MQREERFDSFYRATRQSLVLQTFALTGDLPAAQGAVKDAYVAAWHHWRKASAMVDPLEWVRPRAWHFAQRRHTTRPWHRTKGLGDQHRAVLEAVSGLPTSQRRVLLLTELAAVPLPQAARELGLTQQVAERQRESALAEVTSRLGAGRDDVRPRLEALAEVSDAAYLPRASIIRRSGSKRRRLHSLLAVASAAAVTVGAGVVAHAPSRPGSVPTTTEAARVAPSPKADTASLLGSGDQLPSGDEMLDADQIGRLGPGQAWSVERTDDNTGGDGINTICQKARFADPDGAAALVRTFGAQGRPRRSAVQTVETSRSVQQAEDAFATTVGWYAGCQVARLQLLTAYRVDGIGDQAQLLLLRAWDKPVTTYSVAIARVGQMTTTTVGSTVGGGTPPPRELVQSLVDSVSMLCGLSESSDCPKTPPRISEVPPPVSGEERGMLAVADLPPVGRIDRPWAGTHAVSAMRRNPAATTCDGASFDKAGAARARSRVFLIPGARLPAWFGLAESTGTFASPGAAKAFVRQVEGRIARCGDRDLGAHVSPAPSAAPPGSGIDLATWVIRVEVSAKKTVTFRTGVARLGDRVAQVTFTPTGGDDMTAVSFRNLVVRAGERLAELG